VSILLKVFMKSPSTTNKKRLSKAQSSVQDKLKKFHKQANIVWGKVDLDDLQFLPNIKKGKDVESMVTDEDLDVVDEDSDIDEAEYESATDQYSEDEDFDQISNPNPNHGKSMLYLPSYFGAELCEKIGRAEVMKMEVGLREGQAYEALEDLRVALAQKALLFRTKVRNSDNTKEAARAWTSVNNKSASINKYAATYRSAYQALKNLDALNDNFLPLSNDQLKIPADITEENRIGQKSDSLAWFWKIGQKIEDGMEECMFFYLILSLIFKLTLKKFSSLQSQLVQSPCKVP
jgi:hypothetical protein